MQILQAEKKEYGRSGFAANRAGILGMIALVLLCGFLTGCSGGTLAKGGDIYPYEIHRAENGTLKVILDGSRTPDWQWVVEANDEYYGVYRQGEEKEGKVTFLIRPVKLCDGATLVIRRRAKKSDKPCAVLKLMLSIDSNKTGNGLVANLADHAQSEPGATVLLGRDTGAPLRYYRKETGQLVLTLKNFPDWKLQVENTDDNGSQGKDGQPDPEKTEAEETDEIQLNPVEEEETIDPQYEEGIEAGEWHIEGDDVVDTSDQENSDAEDVAELEEATDITHKVSQEELLDMLELSDEQSLWLGATENEQGLSWYRDPASHLRRGLCGISKDEATMLITFEAGTPGASDIYLESESASYRLYMKVLVDEDGIIRVKKAEYKKIHEEAADGENIEEDSNGEASEDSEESGNSEE